ncbi:hypothetical protein BB560_003055 [Smittium megazygosporum]|uniref:Autophagy-related protein n=1 Tax=Smittium megazygosporum TaxID=133381 RepID=A0A2T9ZD22_9FUNG|nr:hypothetical protein BB560_003055 [Smittium megazygosporum]
MQLHHLQSEFTHPCYTRGSHTLHSALGDVLQAQTHETSSRVHSPKDFPEPSRKLCPSFPLAPPLTSQARHNSKLAKIPTETKILKKNYISSAAFKHTRKTLLFLFPSYLLFFSYPNLRMNTLLVICEKVERSDIANIDKKKYLVPADLTVGQFVYVIRKRIKLSSEKAIFIFVNDTLPPTAALMSAIYSECQDPDGFLYVTYSGENTFGSI